MTLVIFVRCQDGCVLASDRKATFYSGFGDDEPKSRAYQKGWAIAGAGDEEPIQNLITRLEDSDMTRDNVRQTVFDDLRDYYSILGRGEGVACILLIKGTLGVEAHLIQVSNSRSTHRQIITPFECIGEHSPKIIASHYIKERGRYAGKLSKDAAPEILAILQKASKEGSAVGSQQQYGFDLILFKNDEFCYKERDTTEYVFVTPEYRLAEGIAPQYEFTQFESGSGGNGR